MKLKTLVAIALFVQQTSASISYDCYTDPRIPAVGLEFSSVCLKYGPPHINQQKTTADNKQEHDVVCREVAYCMPKSAASATIEKNLKTVEQLQKYLNVDPTVDAPLHTTELYCTGTAHFDQKGRFEKVACPSLNECLKEWHHPYFDKVSEDLKQNPNPAVGHTTTIYKDDEAIH